MRLVLMEGEGGRHKFERFIVQTIIDNVNTGQTDEAIPSAPLILIPFAGIYSDSALCLAL